MVTRSEWIESVLTAWEGEPCPRSDRSRRPYNIDEEGVVWGHCGYRERHASVSSRGTDACRERRRCRGEA